MVTTVGKVIKLQVSNNSLVCPRPVWLTPLVVVTTTEGLSIHPIGQSRKKANDIRCFSALSCLGFFNSRHSVCSCKNVRRIEQKNARCSVMQKQWAKSLTLIENNYKKLPQAAKNADDHQAELSWNLNCEYFCCFLWSSKC